MGYSVTEAATGRAAVGSLFRDGTPLFLAPLATLTHAGFRVLVDELGGCDLYFNEMISASAYLSHSPFERYYRMTEPDPTRLVHQIVGSDEVEMVACAEGLAADGVFGIDVNMGCSAPPIVRKGGGIAWMRDRLRAERLVSRLRRVLPETALSAKLRLGDSDDLPALLSFAEALQNAGLDFVTLHPKTRKDGENRPARWSRIAALRERLTIPVVGNGGVVDRASLTRRIGEGSPAGIMIGRGAAAKPWIFACLRGTARVRVGARPPLDLRGVDVRFRELLAQYQPEAFWPTRAKRFYRYYCSNFLFGYRLGAQIQNLRSYTQMTDHMDRYYDAHPEEAHRPVWPPSGDAA